MLYRCLNSGYGILGYMEEVREDKIACVLALLQAQARG
jgi:hypothetical protein